MSKTKTYNVEITKQKDKNGVNVEVIKALGPLLSSATGEILDRARIEQASFDPGTGLLTLTRDDNTIVSTFISVDGVPTYNSSLDPGVTMPEDVGGFSSGTSVADIDGQTINDILDTLFFPPSVPTASLSGTGAKTVEVGTTISPELQGTYTAGSAGPVLSLSLERNSAEVSTTNPYVDLNLTSATPASFTYQMIFNYDADVLPAGTINTNTVTYDFIYPIFYGVSADASIDAADIIAGTKVVSGDTSPTVTFGSTSSEYSWIAVPASFPTFTNWFITALNQGGIGPAETFGNPTTLPVTTVNWTGVNYELYVTNFSTAITDPITFS